MSGTVGELLDPECAKRPIADEFSSEALLLLANRDRVPRNIDDLSTATLKSPLRSIRDGFIPYILRHHCSLVEGDRITFLEHYWNPFANVKLEDCSRLTKNETARDAMPYRWLRRLRSILVQGPHFCDWVWAQEAQRHERGQSADWFEVDETVIDRFDPDCVWRQRSVSTPKRVDRTFYEIWSPVRWVSLLTKLCTALRTMQVRVLDSGESDVWRFDLRQWSEQACHGDLVVGAEGSLSTFGARSAPPGALGTPWVVNDIKVRNQPLYEAITTQDALLKEGGRCDLRGWMNGVLRPKQFYDEDAGQSRLTSLLYINSNKTSDARKEGAAKGFEVALPIQACPLPPEDTYWVRQGDGMPAAQLTFASARQMQSWLDDLSENIHWWLAKLRDWQEKYNPIDRRVEWKELSGLNVLTERSDEQYEMYRPVCFLFREPAMALSRSHPGLAYPLTDAVVANAWWSLLKAFQSQLLTRAGGELEVRLVLDESGLRTKSCVYDLHSIRVSIITALIIEGKVPVQYVQALVGHSRIVMTIYYTKINPLTMAREIGEGFVRASEAEVENEKLTIQNASIEELRHQLAFNDPDSALAALGASRPPGARNMVMWMRKLGGICPVGGVSHDTEGGLSAGCFNGGALIGGGKGQSAKYAPVEGGPGTCVNCRWFVTKMLFVGEIQAIAEDALYRYYEFRDKTAHQEQAIEGIKSKYERMEADQGALNVTQKVQLDRDLEAAEAIRDGYMDSAALDVMISGNAFRLIQRLGELEHFSGSPNDNTLIATGTTSDLKVILRQTDSAMLHAARISLHAEIHPELNSPSATLRIALGIARKLQDEGLDPFALLSLPEAIQIRAVNAVTRHIASLCSSKSLSAGLSTAVALIESQHKLSDITSTSPLKLKEWVSDLKNGVTEISSVDDSDVDRPVQALIDSVSSFAFSTVAESVTDKLASKSRRLARPRRKSK